MDINYSGPISETVLKEAEYSSCEYERYSTSSPEFRKDGAIMLKITCGEDSKMGSSQLLSSESLPSYCIQTTKNSYNTETSVRKIPHVTSKKVAPYSTLQSQVCYPLSPVPTPGFETFSFCSSDGSSSFAHYSDTQWSSESSWSTSTSMNTVTGNAHFSMYETFTEIETSGSVPSSCPASPTGQTLLASRAIIDQIERVPVQNDIINNSNYNGLYGTVMPDSEIKLMESLEVSNLRNQLPFPEIYHLGEHENNALTSNINHIYPCVQEVAILTKENVEKFELLQLRTKLYSVLPPSVTEGLEIDKKCQGGNGDAQQMENAIHQPRSSIVPSLSENQIKSFELNVAHMALEGQWGLPFTDKKSLAMMLPPLSPLPNDTCIESIVKEENTPVLMENEIYDLEFNLHRKIGMHQWRPTLFKEVNLADSANVNIIESDAETFNERCATQLTLNSAQDWNNLAVIQKSVRVPKSAEVSIKEDSVSLVETQDWNNLADIQKSVGVPKSAEVSIKEDSVSLVETQDWNNLADVQKSVGVPKSAEVSIKEDSVSLVETQDWNNLADVQKSVGVPKSAEVSIKEDSVSLVETQDWNNLAVVQKSVGVPKYAEAPIKEDSVSLVETQDWNNLAVIQNSVGVPKYAEAPIKEDSVSLVENKSEEVETPLVYHEQVDHLDTRSTTPATEVIIKDTPHLSKDNIEYPESHLNRNIPQHITSCFVNKEQLLEEMPSYDLKSIAITGIPQQQSTSTDIPQQQSALTEQPSKTGVEHTPPRSSANESILQNSDIAYRNVPLLKNKQVEVTQLNKTENLTHLNAAALETQMVTISKKSNLPENMQANLPSKAHAKNNIYYPISKQKAMITSPVSISCSKTLTNLESQFLDEKQALPSETQVIESKQICFFDELKTDRTEFTTEQKTSDSHSSIQFSRTCTTDTAKSIEKVQNIVNEPEMYITKKQFKIPPVIQKSVSNSRPNKIPLINVTPLDRRSPRPRPQHVQFIEQDAVDCLEKNLKQKLVSNFWEYPISFDNSMKVMTPKETLTTKTSDTQIKPISVESAFSNDKTRDNLEWHVTQTKQHNWDLAKHFQKSAEVSLSSSAKLFFSPLSLSDTVVIPTELPFVSPKHKKMVERNVNRRNTSNRWGSSRFVQQSLGEFNVAAPLQSESIDRNESVFNNTGVSYPFTLISSQEKMLQNESKNMLLSYECDRRNGETNKLREEPAFISLKLEDQNQLTMCLTKQKVEIKLNCLPNLVLKSYNDNYFLKSKKRLPTLIRFGEGYKRSRALYISFMEHDAIDRLEVNLSQKLISSLWGFPTSYENSLEIMIPKAPPLPPPIQTSATKIEPTSMETIFLEDKVRNYLESHVMQLKLQFNWGLPTEIQRARDAFIPPAPKLISSQLNLQPYSQLVLVLPEPTSVSDHHKKMLETTMKRKIINNRRCLLPNVVQRSLNNFVDFNLIKDLSAHSDNVKRKTSSISTDHHKEIQKLLPVKHKHSRKNIEFKKVEFNENLFMCITKQCLDIKMDHLPNIVKEMYKVTYPLESRKGLPKLITLGKANTKVRPRYISFIEQDAVDRLELNLKHKWISSLWGYETLHEESLRMMISAGLHVPPIIKATDAKIIPTAVKTSFFDNKARLSLEWHITQKKLEHNWSFPLHIQRSQEAFISPAPKLIHSQLNRCPDFEVTVVPNDPAFLDVESKKKIELNVKKRIINQQWGLPKLINLSLENFMSPAPSVKSIKSQLEISEENVSLNSKFETICLQSKLIRLKGEKLSASFCEQAIKFMKVKRKRMPSVIDTLEPKHRDLLDMGLIKQRLEIKLDNLPAIVQECYKNTYPPTSANKTLTKLIAPGEGFKKTRPWYIPFFEQNAVDHLEMNLKNKHISHLWGFQTLYEESMEMMIPKAPSVTPALKANRGKIVPVPMGTTFIGKEIRNKLEWHVIQKKLQHNWGIPSFYQKSVEAVIPVAPKLVQSQLKPQADSILVIILSELPFIDKEINKMLDLNTRKKIINRRWGLPNFIQSSLRHFAVPGPSMNDVMESKNKTRRKPKTNNIEIENNETSFQQKVFVQPQRKKLFSVHIKTDRRNSKTAKLDELSDFVQLKREVKNNLDVCCMKQCLEIHMDCLPESVKKYYKVYYPTSKKSLPQLIVPKNGFKRPRALYISFIEQDIVDHLALNLKHKQINNCLGLKTLYEESMEMMIPKAPPMPPPFKVNGTQIEPVGVEIHFSTDEVRKDLERHITQKKLQHKWGLPLHIQKSQEELIPPAPKLLLSDLKPQPHFVTVLTSPEPAFLHNEHKKILAFNLMKRAVNQKLGLPKLILSSLSNFIAPVPSVKGSMLQSETIKGRKILSSPPIKKAKSDLFPRGLFPLHIRRKLLLPQYKRCSNSKTSNKIDNFADMKPEHKDKLCVCLTKQSLQIKMHDLPEIVKRSYKDAYPVRLKKDLPRLIAPGKGFKRPRSLYISFIEQEAVDRLELNFKHKQIMHLWALDTLYEKSVKMLIPEGPNVSPIHKSSEVQIVTVGMETAFINNVVRDNLEWHITRKKLETNCSFPLHIQKSMETFIPSAPKLVPSELKPHCIHDAVVASTEPLHISAEDRNRLEMNTQKRIINQKWDLPNLIQSSLRDFITPIPSLQGNTLQSQSIKGSKTFTHIVTDLNSKISIGHKKEKFPSQLFQKVDKKANFQKMSTFPDVSNLKPECKDTLNMCLLKQILDIKTNNLPGIVQEFYKSSYPTSSKKTLPKLIVSHEGCKKQRPWCLPFIEQDVINHLELNLKHRQIIHLWRLETLYDESMEMMIPKGPPVPPVIKASEAKIEFVGMECAFIEYNVRDKLEWHITQKNLQQNWGLPLHIKLPTENFIPPAPILIPSHLNPQFNFGVVVAPTEPTFLNKGVRKLLELNTKKKLINHKWGLPILIQSSLRKSMVLPPSRKDLVSEIAEDKTKPNNILKRSRIIIPSQRQKVRDLSLQCEDGSKNTSGKMAKVAYPSNFKQEYIDKLDMCLRKMHLEINMHCLPEIVKESYKEKGPSISKKPLRKIIAPGNGCKKPHSLYMPFIEPGAVDYLELNLKHKQIFHLWGLVSPNDKSLEMMIAEVPPLPPAIKSSGVKIVHVSRETPFLDSEKRENFERYVTQKKLQKTWGLPLDVQISKEAFIPLAPKLIPFELTREPAVSVAVTLTELPFILNEHKKILEMNTKKKIINNMRGLPNLIQFSLNKFITTTPDACSNINVINVGSTENKMVLHNSCTTIRRGKFTALQYERKNKSEKTKQMDADFSLTSFKPELKDKLEICLTKLSLEIKTGCLPKMVEEFSKNTYPSQSRKLLPKLIVLGEGFKKPRPHCLPFIEQDTVDHLEMHLKHKLITHLWKFPNLYEESVEIMMSKGPSEPPIMKRTTVIIHPVGTETHFVKDNVRDRLEWHIEHKKLQRNWGLPLLTQKSQEAFIPPAPKLVRSELKPQPGFPLIFVSPEMAFVTSEHRKRLSLNTKKRIINHRWGLPNTIQSSLNNFTTLPVLPCEELEISKISSSNSQMEDEKIDDTSINTILQTKKKLSSKQSEKGSSNLKSSNVEEICHSPVFNQESKNRLEICLIKQCLEAKNNCLPEIVNAMYETAYSLMSKKPFLKPVAPGKGLKRPRLAYIPFIEKDAIDHLEMNLKHKLLTHLSGFPTQYEESVAIMIPNVPPELPVTKANKIRIEFVGMETTFIDKKTKDLLEWHIAQKELQHKWDLPLHIQRSRENFIPAAPKIIQSQLKQEFCFVTLCVPIDVPFLSDGHRQMIESNTRKRIINCRWGMPKLVQLSENNFIPAAPQTEDFNLPQDMTVPIFIVPTSSGSIIQLRRKLPSPTYPRSAQIKNYIEVFSSDNHEVTCRAAIDFCIIKQCLEIKMEHLPELVMHAYSVSYGHTSKKILPKTILPGKGSKKQRLTYMPFIEQEAIDRLELNLIHKQLTHQWGFPTLYKESMEIMLAVVPPLPPLIKASGARIKPVGMENNFLKNEIRDRLELHITQKKIQYNWGLPLHIQGSLEALILPAPNHTQTEINFQPNAAIAVAPFEPVFVTNKHKQTLNQNIKKRIIHRKWGLPKIVDSSLNQFLGPTPYDEIFIQPENFKESSTMFNNANLGRSFKMFSQSRTLRLKGGKLGSQFETDEISINEVKEVAASVILRSKCEENLDNMSVLRQCLEIKIGCLPELVKEYYKCTYPSASKKSLPKPSAPGKGLKKPRIRYIPFAEQDDIDQIEMNLKHKQLLYLWGLETQYEKSMEMMIPKGPPIPPSIQDGRVQIKSVSRPTTYFSDEIRNFLERHILQKKLECTWGLPSHFQKSTEAFIPPAPKLILAQLYPQLNVEIVVVPTELEFINDEHKNTLEINIKKRIVNHIRGLPQLVESSLNGFMPPPPPIKYLVKQFKSTKKYTVSSRMKGSSNGYEMVFPGCTSLLNIEQKNASYNGSLKGSVKMKKGERKMSTLTELIPECSDKLNMCLIKQSLSIKLHCVPELVTELYKQSYPPAMKKSLPKLITHVKGFKRTRLPDILFADQDIINRLDTNLKHKQINNLWGIATTFDKSIEMMIPQAPPLLPAIKASGAKVQHIGMELAFQSSETIEILERHITAKRFQYQWGIPLHIRRSIDKFIPSPPKLVLSQFSQYPDFGVDVSADELIFPSVEFKETLEININNRIINNRDSLPNIIQASLNRFIPPFPSVKDVMPLSETGEGSTTGFNRPELNKIDTDLSADLKLCVSTVSLPNCEDGKGSSSVNNMEIFPVDPNLESEDEVDADMTMQSLELQPVYRCSYSAASKTLPKLNTPYRRFKKQNLKSKWSDDCLEVQCSIASPSYRPKCMKTVGSSIWTTNWKLADLTYKPMTIVGLSLVPAMIGANGPLFPMTLQKDFNIYLKQNMGSLLLSRSILYADCEELLAQYARDVGNVVFYPEDLTEEAKIHFQSKEHGYVKIIAGAFVKKQNDKEKIQVGLSEIFCAQTLPTGLCDTLQERIIAAQDPDDGNYLSVSDEELHGAYYENLNKSYHSSRTHVAKKKCRKTSQSWYSNQTKPDKSLVKSKAKFSKQDCQRPRIYKHKEEERKPELFNQSIIFVSPTEELCWSDTDEEEESASCSPYYDRPESPMSTGEIYRHDERSPQSSTSHCSGCQQVLSHENSPFATNEDCEVYYQCESPMFPHSTH
ncbi:uncharacterized protein LOC119977343 [Scyliorhinus canicula]|uniref:uncharacterized protein LOC119977343 n=1 Tax=Scyliorhinus canicula TaxID=7830 RepID=UPI0018F5354C|nr:uncharacterized protein LOC119977343 [Scyliorhinus canicula]